MLRVHILREDLIETGPGLGWMLIVDSMDIIKKSVHNLNPGQIPVLTVDQPLYAIAKRIQWNWPDSHGEDHFVIVLGGLHIEMATMKCTPCP